MRSRAKSRLKGRPAKRVRPQEIQSREVAAEMELVERQFAKEFEDFSRPMRECEYLKGLDPVTLDELLKELYRCSKLKKMMERIAVEDRSEAVVQRKWSVWLRSVTPWLRNIRRELFSLAKGAPASSPVELPFDGPDFREALIRIDRQTKKAVEMAERLETLVVALMNPGSRTKAESKRVTMELLDHFKLPPGPKSPELDLLFIREAAGILDQFRDPDGNKIKRQDIVISKLFDTAFREKRTAGSVRKELRKKRFPSKRA